MESCIQMQYTLRQKFCLVDQIFVTIGVGNYHNDNILYSYWHQITTRNDDIYVLVQP